MIELGGGTYVGIQASFRDRHDVLHEDLVLFNSPSTGSTLALPISQISARAVSASILKSDTEFERYAEKACGRVLSQFASKQRKPKNLAVAA